jgi:hypothetical protein
MGTSYSAKIVVGLPFCAIPNAQELLDDDKLRDFSYYYDCCEDDRIVGVEVTGSGSYSYSELDDLVDLEDYINKAMQAFNRKTGLDGKTYLTVCSY